MKIKEHKILIRAWREQVMEKTRGMCAYCGKTATEAHHINTKGSSSWVMEYDVQNGVGLCTQHHRDAHQGGEDAETVNKVIASHLMLHHGVTMDELRLRSRQMTQKRQWTIDELVEKLNASDTIG